jgi:hypothetical protein
MSLETAGGDCVQLHLSIDYPFTLSSCVMLTERQAEELESGASTPKLRRGQS